MRMVEQGLGVVNNLKFLQLLPKIGVSDCVEIIILAFIIYYCIKSFKDTRAWLLFKSVILGLCIYMVAYLLELSVIVAVFQSLVVFLGMAIVIAVQPEIRKFMENMGNDSTHNSLFALIKNTFTSKSKKNVVIEKKIDDNTVQELVKGCFAMSKAKTGALICIEGNIPLNEYIDSGIVLDAITTSALLINTFEKNTPLHDGAVIIRKDRMVAATCYLPLSESKKINKSLGTRHRAAIGLSEVTDCIVIVVSEETGAVSTVRNGEIHRNLDREQLVEELRKFQNSFEVVKIHKSLLHKSAWPQKIISLVCGAMLWVVVVNAVNPVSSTTIRDVPIRVINEDAITSLDKTYEIVSSDTVDVKIKGLKSELDQINELDISVTADLKKLSITNSVPLEIEIPNYPEIEFEVKDNIMSISVEDITTIEMGVTVEMPNDVENTYVSGISLSDDRLTISGAKSIVDTIGSVIVKIDKDKLNDNSSIELIPQIYDRNGELINNSKLKLSAPTIVADVELYNTKDVELIVEYTIPNDRIRSIIENVEVDTQTITIAGPDKVLDAIDKVIVNTELDFNIQDISKKQYTKKIDIREFISNEAIVTSKNSMISIIITFKDFKYTEIEMTEADIEIRGAAGKEINILPASYSIAIMSLYADISDITVKDIKPYIDINNKTDGDYNIDIQFGGYGSSVVGRYSVDITISTRGS